MKENSDLLLAITREFFGTSSSVSRIRSVHELSDSISALSVVRRGELCELLGSIMIYVVGNDIGDAVLLGELVAKLNVSRWDFHDLDAGDTGIGEWNRHVAGFVKRYGEASKRAFLELKKDQLLVLVEFLNYLRILPRSFIYLEDLDVVVAHACSALENR